MQTLESRLTALRNKATAPTAQNWKPKAGEALQIMAKDQDHAQWLKQMNPKPPGHK